jgi:hypothetical protein
MPGTEPQRQSLTVFDIIGVYRGESEVIDSADDRETARYLVGEYQLAYGSGWRVFYRRSR